MKKILCIFLFCIFGSSCTSACDTDASVTVVDGFFKSIKDNKISSIPSTDQFSKIEKKLTPSLAKLILKVSENEATHYQTQKDSEPPIYEGNMFGSLVEGFSRYNIKDAESKENDIKVVNVAFEYVGMTPQTMHPFDWIDSVVVLKVNDQCLIDDIYFDKKISSDSSLRSRLNRIISENNPDRE
jgi:hypothetical protein